MIDALFELKSGDERLAIASPKIFRLSGAHVAHCLEEVKQPNGLSVAELLFAVRHVVIVIFGAPQTRRERSQVFGSVRSET